jgi:cation:H+ antiporter
VGTILAPLFTSFPEMIVFLVAVFGYSGTSGEQIGIGTLFGQPFMASSLSYGLVGFAALIGFLLKKRSSTVLVVDKTLAIPYTFITVLFPLALVPSFVHLSLIKHLCGMLFLAAFIYYTYLMYQRRTAERIEDATEPYLSKVTPKGRMYTMVGATIQLMMAVMLLYEGSKKLVELVDTLSKGAGISPTGLALILVPAATAIPETSSALIWGYRGKDTLSIGSLVGEKILYSTFYPAMGMFLTSWVLDIHAYSSVIATTIVSLILLYYIAKQKMPWYGLCFGLFFFALYALMIFMFRM